MRTARDLSMILDPEHVTSGFGFLSDPVLANLDLNIPPKRIM